MYHRTETIINMNPIQRTSALNNLGISLLETKDTMNAIQTFRTAVNLMKDFTFELTEQLLKYQHQQRLYHQSFISSSPSSVIMNQDAITSMFTTPYGTFQPCSKVQAANEIDGLNNGYYYVFNRPLLLPTDVTYTGWQGKDNTDMVTASAVLVFNFGLACHHFAMESGQSDVLHQAMQIYELALRMVYQSEIPETFCKVFMCGFVNLVVR